MVTKIRLSSGSEMPGLGIGTWEARNEQELEEALDAALEAGYRHIDTAFVYENETVVGRVLKKWMSSGKLNRNDIFITTKLPMVGVHPDRVNLFMKKSLENLQLDYVDLYLIHFPVGLKYENGQVRPLGPNVLEGKTDHVAIWKKMEEQVDAGRAKNIGLSNYSIAQIETVLKAARIKPANLQIEIHVYFQQRPLVDFCQKNGISVVAYSPLGSPGYNKFMQRLGKQTKDLPDILGDKVIGKIAEKHNKSPAQIALRFLIQRNIVPIPKSVTPKRVVENLNVFDFELSESEMKELFALEVGDSARVCDFTVYAGLTDHPDFPL